MEEPSPPLPEDGGSSHRSAPDWSTYQDQVAQFFRELGLGARTNVRVEGARTAHDIDVLVEFTSAGLDVTWVVECKHWKRPIPKERVLILAGVVDDVGADRGLVVAESGYQAGAIRAAQHVNITLTSLSDLHANTEIERARAEISGLADRISALNQEVRKTWEWAPPSAPQGAISVDRMVEFAGDVFELHNMILPRLVANAWPIPLAFMNEPVVAHDASELRPVLVKRIEGAEVEAAALERAVGAAAERARQLLGAFEDSLRDLLQAGRSLTSLSGPANDESLRFLASMRAVGDGAEQLRTVLPRTVRRELSTLMRWLIDNTYVVEDHRRPDWDAEKQMIDALTQRLRQALDKTVAAPD